MAQDRYVHSDDHNDITQPVRPRRIEVISGDDRRRKWPDEAKIAIVAEALSDGAVVSRVARRHDLTPSQLFGWIKIFRADAMMAASSGGEQSMFARAVVDMAREQSSQPAPSQAEDTSIIEISIGTATVRIRGAADAKTLALVLKALKVLA